MESTEFIKQHYYTNAHLREMLLSQARSGHLCHAYMFFGPDGVGKLTLARLFAAAILCKGQEKPCMQCESCQKISHQNHPDYYEYAGKRGHDAIHIEEIRNIRKEAYILPNDGDYKVYVLPNVEDMSTGAANAFLKVLEEPPEHTVFLLTANSREAVLPTVRSRSIMLEVFPIQDQAVLEALKAELPEESEEKLLLAVAASDGLIGKAFDIVSDQAFSEITKGAAEAARRIAQKNEYEFLKLATEFSKTRESSTAFLSCLYAILRRALIAKLQSDFPDGLCEEIAAKLSVKKLYRICESVVSFHGSNAANVNLTLLAGGLTAQIFEILL